jgi:hypothetical protein
MWQDSQRSTIFASATLICTIAGSQSAVFFFSPSICCGVRSTMWSVMYSSIFALAAVTGFSTPPRSRLSLVRSSRISLYFSSSCGKVNLRLGAVRELDRGLLGLVGVISFCLLAFADGAGAGLEFVGKRIHVCAPVGKHALHRQQAGARIVQFLRASSACSFGILIRLVVRLFERRVVRVLLDVFLGLRDFDRAVFRNAL